MQYFLKDVEISVDNLHEVIRLCGLPIDIGHVWTVSMISINSREQIIEYIRPFYRPCHAMRILNPILVMEESTAIRAGILTVIKQLVKQEGTYKLMKREKYNASTGKQMIYYLQPNMHYIDSPINVLME
jgi:hypothetical protein